MSFQIGQVGRQAEQSVMNQIRHHFNPIFIPNVKIFSAVREQALCETEDKIEVCERGNELPQASPSLSRFCSNQTAFEREFTMWCCIWYDRCDVGTSAPAYLHKSRVLPTCPGSYTNIDHHLLTRSIRNVKHFTHQLRDVSIVRFAKLAFRHAPHGQGAHGHGRVPKSRCHCLSRSSKLEGRLRKEKRMHGERTT